MSARSKSFAARMVLAIAIAGGGSAGLSQNIITNGSFDGGFFNGTGGVMALGDGSTAIAGWQVIAGSSGGIQWLTENNLDGFSPSEGLRFLNLAGTSAGADGAGVQLALPLAVVPGQYYELTFDLGTTSQDHWLYTDPSGLPGPGVQLIVNGVGGVSQGGFFFFGDTSLPNNDGNNRWTPENTGPFEATGYWLAISFSSIGYGGETFVGLDNVQVVPVPAPEPSAMTLLALGGLVLGPSLARSRKGGVVAVRRG